MSLTIGVPREIKVEEHRVGLVPESVRTLTSAGVPVLVESGAGAGIGADDAEYAAAGARIAAESGAIWREAGLVVKVKEPQPAECPLLRPGQILFTYLHLAGDPRQAAALLASGATCVAYETVTDANGRLPLLAPMSEIAGRMAVIEGAHHLGRPRGGRGILLAGATGVAPANVVVLGAGVAGGNAARLACAMGARVTALDRDADALARLAEQCQGHLAVDSAGPDRVAAHVEAADLVIGAVLLPGRAAPRLIERALLSRMRAGSVIVDIAIDQGGCCATSRPTTHREPTYVVDGVIHYCVANMPGAVPRTSAYALNAATLPRVLELAHGGLAALRANPRLRDGLNIHAGRVTHAGVAAALGLPAADALAALSG